MNVLWIDCKYDKDDWSLAASMVRRLMQFFDGNVKGREASVQLDWRYDSLFDIEKAVKEHPLLLVKAFTWPQEREREEQLLELFEGCVRRGHFIILLATGKMPREALEDGSVIYLKETKPTKYL